MFKLLLKVPPVVPEHWDLFFICGQQMVRPYQPEAELKLFRLPKQ
jgi:hypothetical protein